MDRGFEGTGHPRAKLLLDTDVLLSVFEGDGDIQACTDLVRKVVEARDVRAWVSVLAVGEVQAHYTRMASPGEGEGEASLERCLRWIQSFDMLDITRPVAREAGRIKGLWDRVSTEILPWPDALMAALARHIGAILVTQNAAFWREGIKGQEGCGEDWRTLVLHVPEVCTPREVLLRVFS
ncbi:MAG: PIN domain-containing protein [Alicyclobacillaceae bacterium]|nr:PIN domain-containing protein [Alicyclobacillaceae bacterium]